MVLRRRPGHLVRPGAAAALLFLLIVPAAVSAHAELEASSPGVGATVTGPLDQVVLTFTEALASKSFFRVESGGEQVARGNVDAGNPNQMVAQTASLGPGTYRVVWVSYAADLHQEKGNFEFTIEAATPPPATPTPAATPSAGPSATASPPPSASPTPAPTLTPVPVPTASPAPGPVNATAGDVAVPIIAALLVVGGIALWLVRRQRRA